MPVYEEVSGFTDAAAELEALGFELTGLFAVNRDQRLRMIEFDAAAIRASDGQPPGGDSSNLLNDAEAAPT
jgi:hypothetical protein